MILGVLSLTDESESLLLSIGPIVWIGILIEFLSDDSSDGYLGDIVGVSGRCKYRLKSSSIICIVP